MSLYRIERFLAFQVKRKNKFSLKSILKYLLNATKEMLYVMFMGKVLKFNKI